MIPVVAASESGTAQTEHMSSPKALYARGRGIRLGGVSDSPESKKSDRYLNGLERPTIEGDSPVREIYQTFWIEHPSTAGHEKSCGNSGGPSPKAKYYITTDSEQVP